MISPTPTRRGLASGHLPAARTGSPPEGRRVGFSLYPAGCDGRDRFPGLDRVEGLGSRVSVGNPVIRASGHSLPSSRNATGCMSPGRTLSRSWMCPGGVVSWMRRVLLGLGLVAPANRIRPQVMAARRERWAALFISGGTLR